MTKVTSERIEQLKALFQDGDIILETSCADLITAIAEAAQEHEHVSTGGPGTGTGDAGPVDHGELTGLEDDDHEQYLTVARHDVSERHPPSVVTGFQSGLDADKPELPTVGDIYLATDTGTLYVCLAPGAWQSLGGPSAKAPPEEDLADTYLVTPASLVHVEDGGDTGWVDLDLSSHVPVGATGVLLDLSVYRELQVATLLVRKKGYTGDIHPRVYAVTGYHWVHNFVIVECDEDRTIQYALQGQGGEATASYDINLLGYTST